MLLPSEVVLFVEYVHFHEYRGNVSEDNVPARFGILERRPRGTRQECTDLLPAGACSIG